MACPVAVLQDVASGRSLLQTPAVLEKLAHTIYTGSRDAAQHSASLLFIGHLTTVLKNEPTAATCFLGYVLRRSSDPA